MIVRTCRKCGCKVFLWYEDGRDLISGEFCGCPYNLNKYRETQISDGILVVMEEKEIKVNDGRYCLQCGSKDIIRITGIVGWRCRDCGFIIAYCDNGQMEYYRTFGKGVMGNYERVPEGCLAIFNEEEKS